MQIWATGTKFSTDSASRRISIPRREKQKNKLVCLDVLLVIEFAIIGLSDFRTDIRPNANAWQTFQTTADDRWVQWCHMVFSKSSTFMIVVCTYSWFVLISWRRKNRGTASRNNIEQEEGKKRKKGKKQELYVGDKNENNGIEGEKKRKKLQKPRKKL